MTQDPGRSPNRPGCATGRGTHQKEMNPESRARRNLAAAIIEPSQIERDPKVRSAICRPVCLKNSLSS